jgi:UDP-glucose 4-epimerase
MKLSEKQPEEVLNEVESLDKAYEQLINQVVAKEREKLDAVFIRYCIKYKKVMDYSKIKPVNLPHKKNYTEYYYRNTNGTIYLLMTAELKVVENTPVLEIIPNKELAFNDEI